MINEASIALRAGPPTNLYPSRVRCCAEYVNQLSTTITINYNRRFRRVIDSFNRSGANGSCLLRCLRAKVLRASKFGKDAVLCARSNCITVHMTGSLMLLNSWVLNLFGNGVPLTLPVFQLQRLWNSVALVSVQLQFLFVRLHCDFNKPSLLLV